MPGISGIVLPKDPSFADSGAFIHPADRPPVRDQAADTATTRFVLARFNTRSRRSERRTVATGASGTVIPITTIPWPPGPCGTLTGTCGCRHKDDCSRETIPAVTRELSVPARYNEQVFRE